MNKFILFLSNFLKDPKSVGAIVPLSECVIKQLVKCVKNRDPQKPCRILEVGAGIGNVTSSIMKLLSPEDRFDIIEIEPDSCEVLKNSFSQDSRVSIQCMSVIDWMPDYKYDYIISTLPLNCFEPSFVEEIFLHYQQMLKADGILTYVEYMGLQQINLAFSQGSKRELISKRLALLKGLQKRYLVEKREVFCNFLPCHVYHMNMHTNAPFH